MNELDCSPWDGSMRAAEGHEARVEHMMQRLQLDPLTHQHIHSPDTCIRLFQQRYWRYDEPIACGKCAIFN